MGTHLTLVTEVTKPTLGWFSFRSAPGPGQASGSAGF